MKFIKILLGLAILGIVLMIALVLGNIVLSIFITMGAFVITGVVSLINLIRKGFRKIFSKTQHLE